MNNKNKRIALIVVAALIGISIWVVKDFFVGGFSYAGTVEATRIDLPARLATTIKEFLVQEGESVQAEQLLVKLSCEDISLQKNLAQENYDRAVNLKKTGSISKEVFDLAQNKFEDANTRASWCEVKSPISGKILTRFLEPSEWVNPGTKLLTVANLDELWVYFYVPQNVMSKLKIGSEVRGEVPEINSTFQGRISKINEEAEFTPKNVQTQSERTRLIYGVKVIFKNSDHQLKPGMTIESNLGQVE